MKASRKDKTRMKVTKEEILDRRHYYRDQLHNLNFINNKR